MEIEKIIPLPIILVILAALLAAFFQSVIRRKLKERETFNTAATTFRSRVLTELEGIYPVTQFWDEIVYSRLRQSIPKVQTAAAEFSFFFKRKRKFDAAVNEYCEYYRTITWGKAVEWDMYTSSRKPHDVSPMKKGENIIKHLLSFAEKTR